MHPRAGRTLAVTLSQFAEAHASYSYLRMHEAKRLVYAVRRLAPELLSEALARPPAAASGRNGHTDHAVLRSLWTSPPQRLYYRLHDGRS